MRAAIMLLAPLLLTALNAAAADLAAQPACRTALRALTVAEAAAEPASAASAATSSGRLTAARRQAAVACLGPAAAAASGPPLGARQVLPPAPAMGIGVPRLVSPSSAAAPPPVPAPRPPVSITSCDPVGCWASDGSRLQRAGPMLIGPRGMCSSAAGVLSCP
ncbi:MAG: hypothetical protein LCI02_17625 [Proteobacteria bacterium]|nr:hypothetical protein [Pseudomonadota bacterium]